MRRKWITLLRIIRYGISNFTRNAWLTTAATAVMIITLTVLLVTFTAQLIFNDTINQVRSKIDVSVYLCDLDVPGCEDDVTDEQKKQLETAIRAVPIVTDIAHFSKQQALDKFIDDSKGDLQQLSAIGTLDGKNPLPASMRVYVKDVNKLSLILDVVNKDEFKKLQARPASIAGDRKEVIENIARVAQFASIAGLSVSGLFIIISIMIIFNTIRMAIFNRREEIEIMKLIGAEKSFIRGPFIVEASLYGVIAAVVSTTLIYMALVFAGPGIGSYGLEMGQTTKLFTDWPWAILLAQVLIGIIIGIISSFMAMRRYLKV